MIFYLPRISVSTFQNWHLKLAVIDLFVEFNLILPPGQTGRHQSRRFESRRNCFSDETKPLVFDVISDTVSSTYPKTYFLLVDPVDEFPVGNSERYYLNNFIIRMSFKIAASTVELHAVNEIALDWSKFKKVIWRVRTPHKRMIVQSKSWRLTFNAGTVLNGVIKWWDVRLGTRQISLVVYYGGQDWLGYFWISVHVIFKNKTSDSNFLV